MSEKRHFANALIGKLRHFKEHVDERAVDFFAARVGHHAVGAILGTALHDRNEGGRSLGVRHGKMVELLDFGKAHVHLRATGLLTLSKKFGETVQGLGPEDGVHVGSALQNTVAFLRRHAPAHGDAHFGMKLLHVANATEIREDLLLRLFADGAGIDDDEIRLFEVFRTFVSLLVGQKVRKTGGVVIVHLAAEAAQIEFFR